MSEEYIKDELTGFDYIPLESDDTFSYKCVQCGNCCRNVTDAIPLESLDVFRLAKFLGKPIEEVVGNYSEMRLLTAKFPMLFLKTKPGPVRAGECVFLKNNLCSVNAMKPRTCRMYPMSSGINDDGELDYIWAAKEHHQYRPGNQMVSEWMSSNLSKRDRDFLMAEHGFVIEMSRILRRVPEQSSTSIQKLMLIYRYFLYDTAEDFLPQYKRNMLILLAELKRLAGRA